MTQVEVGQEQESQVEDMGEDQEEGQVKKTRAKRGSPTYAVKGVSELPVQVRGQGLQTRDRKHIYVPLLAQVAQTPGQWFELARYTSTTGARSAAKAVAEDITSGEIPIEGGSFEFETRRNVSDGVGEDGQPVMVPSVLYAKFVRS